jgi:serine/threonine-protein phosphatase 5
LVPNDKDAKQKLDLAKKEKRLKDFSESILVEEKKLEIEWKDMTVEDSYDGPRLEEDMSNLSSEWCIKLKDFLKNQKKLHKRYVSQLACAMREYFET